MKPKTKKNILNDSKKKKNSREDCIRVEIFKKIGNPHPVDFCKLYKPVNPKPTSSLAIEIAQWNASNSRRVRFEKWDLSRPDEPPYSRKAYMFVAETTEKGDIESLKQEINRVEDNYKIKLEEMTDKIEKRPTIIEALSV